MMRDKFRCRLCNASNKFLNVHHIFYKKGAKAWEYDNDSLLTLCEDCHEFTHNSLPKITALISLNMVKDGACLIDIERELRDKLGLKNNDIIPF